MTADVSAYTATSSHHRYGLVLPGNWASIPMSDPEALRARVSRLVKAQVPRDDRMAVLRRNIREELLESAGSARTAGATLYALSLELLPGLPFPASLITFDTQWPPQTPSTGELHDRLAAAFPESTPVENAPVPAVRQTSLRARTLSESTIPVLDLTYLFAGPGEGLVSIMVSVPNCPSPELVVQLFDMIAASIHWAIPAEAQA